jgi:4-hydroxybenzoate polyprenyltransferase
MTLKSLKGNKTFLVIGLSVVAVFPLLIITFIIGKAALWLWLGLLLGAIYMTWEIKRYQKKQQQERPQRWEQVIDEKGMLRKEGVNRDESN